MDMPDAAEPKSIQIVGPEPPELLIVDGHRVSCDGGGGALGHPKVWYEIGEDGFVDCGYCDRRFALRGSPADRTRQR